jgi:hypothetical protein
MREIPIYYRFLFKDEGNTLTPEELYVYFYVAMYADSGGYYKIDYEQMYEDMQLVDYMYTIEYFKEQVNFCLIMLELKEVLFYEAEDYVRLYDLTESREWISIEQWWRSKDQYQFYVTCYVDYVNMINEYRGKLEDGCGVSKRKWCELMEIDQDMLHKIFGEMVDERRLFILPGGYKQVNRYWCKIRPLEIEKQCLTTYHP